MARSWGSVRNRVDVRRPSDNGVDLTGSHEGKKAKDRAELADLQRVARAVWHDICADHPVSEGQSRLRPELFAGERLNPVPCWVPTDRKGAGDGVTRCRARPSLQAHPERTAHAADLDLAGLNYGANLSSMADRHLVTIEVAGRPATFATAHERPWKEAVRAAVAATGVQPLNARFAVRVVFRLATARNANEVWDLDNLVKPTLDAMEGVFGLRAFRGAPQPADDRVDRLEASKRLPRGGEAPGATIDVWTIDSD